MPRKVGRDVYHPLRFNEYSAIVIHELNVIWIIYII